MARVMSKSRCHEAGSRKKTMPAIAMIAAPPAKVTGTDEKGPRAGKQKERDHARTNADAGKCGVIKSLAAELLVPAAGEVKKGEVAKDAQCGNALHDKAAESVADALRREACKNLMRAVKDGCDDCIPKPRCHERIVG